MDNVYYIHNMRQDLDDVEKQTTFDNQINTNDMKYKIWDFGIAIYDKPALLNFRCVDNVLFNYTYGFNYVISS